MFVSPFISLRHYFCKIFTLTAQKCSGNLSSDIQSRSVACLPVGNLPRIHCSAENPCKSANTANYCLTPQRQWRLPGNVRDKARNRCRQEAHASTEANCRLHLLLSPSPDIFWRRGRRQYNFLQLTIQGKPFAFPVKSSFPSAPGPAMPLFPADLQLFPARRHCGQFARLHQVRK